MEKLRGNVRDLRLTIENAIGERLPTLSQPENIFGHFEARRQDAEARVTMPLRDMEEWLQKAVDEPQEWKRAAVQDAKTLNTVEHVLLDRTLGERLGALEKSLGIKAPAKRFVSGVA